MGILLEAQGYRGLPVHARGTGVYLCPFTPEAQRYRGLPVLARGWTYFVALSLFLSVQTVLLSHRDEQDSMGLPPSSSCSSLNAGVPVRCTALKGPTGGSPSWEHLRSCLLARERSSRKKDPELRTVNSMHLRRTNSLYLMSALWRWETT